jgi:type IV pilus assembly protein PilA
MRKLMSKKGFTLVELMIVVVIMGILVAVAVPVYGAVTKNARKKTCQSNIRIIKENITQYQMTGGQDGATIESASVLQSAVNASNPTFLNLFEGGVIPSCPTDNTSKYSITVDNTSGTTTYNVLCTSSEADAHNA